MTDEEVIRATYDAYRQLHPAIGPIVRELHSRVSATAVARVGEVVAR